jgi:thiol-disulfide isomerase/thioredoxin
MPPAVSAPRSRNSLTFALVVGAAAVVLLLLVWRNRADNSLPQHASVGKKLPALELAPLTGTSKPMSTADLQGKVTLINFWGPWCGFCLQELPHLVRMRKQFSDRDDVQFLFVSCSPDWRPNTPPALGWREDLADLRERTARLLKKERHEIAAHADPHGLTRQAFASLDAWEGYPTTLLIDRDGVIRLATIGYSPGEEYAIEEALREIVESEASH